MIILLCSTFPYEGGETFLISEINYLSKKNEKIIIYPIEKTNNNLILNLQDNVIVKSIVKKTCFKSIIITLFSKSLWQEIIYVLESRPTLKKIVAAIVYQFKINSLFIPIYEDVKLQVIDEEKIEFYSYWMHIHACIARRLKYKFPNSRFITRCHGYDLYEFRSSSTYLPEREQIFKSVDLIAPVSCCGMRYLQKTYNNLNNKKMKVLYLGTDDYGINEFDYGQIRLVSCSNLVDLKRIDLIIDALSYIQDTNINWVHYGDGPLNEKLKKYASEKLGPNIEYEFKGFINNNELMKEYKINPYTLFIHASETEGLPVSFMEAMSFGIPVLCTDVGGCSEIVRDGYNGLIVEKDISAENYSKKIQFYIKLDKLSQIRYRKFARKTWEEKFNANKNYENFYRMLTY